MEKRVRSLARQLLLGFGDGASDMAAAVAEARLDGKPRTRGQFAAGAEDAAGAHAHEDPQDPPLSDEADDG